MRAILAGYRRMSTRKKTRAVTFFPTYRFHGGLAHPLRVYFQARSSLYRLRRQYRLRFRQ
jgi:hypothetical protein